MTFKLHLGWVTQFCAKRKGWVHNVFYNHHIFKCSLFILTSYNVNNEQAHW